MQNRIKETKRLHKYIYEGMDSTIMMAPHRMITLNKTETMSPKLFERSPTNKKNAKLIKKLSRNDLKEFQYRRDNEILLNLPTPPFFFYIPGRLEMQMIIRKACNVKSVNDLMFYI